MKSIFFLCFFLIFHLVFSKKIYKLGGLTPALFPPEGFEAMNGTVLTYALELGEEYVNKFLLKYLDAEIDLEIKAIGEDYSIYAENSELAIQAYKDLEKSASIGTIGLSYSEVVEDLKNAVEIKKPLIGFAQKNSLTGDIQNFLRMNPAQYMFCESSIDAVYGLGIKKINFLVNKEAEFSKNSFVDCSKRCKEVGVSFDVIEYKETMSKEEKLQVFQKIKDSPVELNMLLPTTTMTEDSYIEFLELANSKGLRSGDNPKIFFFGSPFYFYVDEFENPIYEGILYIKDSEGFFTKRHFLLSEIQKKFGVFNEYAKIYFDSVLAYGEAIRLMLEEKLDPNDPELLFNYLMKIDIIGSFGRVYFIEKLNGERSSDLRVTNIHLEREIEFISWSIDQYFKFLVPNLDEIYITKTKSLSYLNGKISTFIPKEQTKWFSVSSITPKVSFGYCSVLYKNPKENDFFIYFGGSNLHFLKNDMYYFEIISESWKSITPRDENNKPEGVSYHGCAMHGNDLYVFGGRTKNIITADINVWNVDKLEWTKFTILESPTPRYGHSWIFNKYDKETEEFTFLSLFGLTDNGLNSEIWQLNPMKQQFRKIECSKSEESPKARYLQSTFKNSKGSIFVYGGITNLINNKESSELWKLTIGKDESEKITGIWKRLGSSEDNGIQKRSRFAGTVINDIYFMFFGYSYEHDTVMDDIIALDISENTLNFNFTTIEYDSDFDVIPPVDIDVVGFDSSVILFGGIKNMNKRNEKAVFETHTFDVLNRLYLKVEEDQYTPSPFSNFASFIQNENIYTFGGRDLEGSKLNDINKFNLNKYVWEKVNIQGSRPSPREATCFAEMGSSLFIFGGKCSTADEFLVFNELYKFLPSEDSSKSTFSQISYSSDSVINVGRYDCTLSTHKSSNLVLIGGYGLNFIEFNKEFHIFNIEKKKWTAVPYNMTKEVKNEFLGLIACNSFFLNENSNIMHIQGCSTSRKVSNYIYKLDIETGELKVEFNLPPQFVRKGASIIVMNDHSVLMFGGINNNGLASSSLLKLNFKDHTVKELSGIGVNHPKPKFNSNCHFFSSKIFCIAGANSILLKEDSRTYDNTGFIIRNSFFSDVWGFNFEDLTKYEFQCSKGTFFDSETGSCLSCTKGSYKEIIGNSRCLNCSKGFYSDKIGSSSADGCLPCSSGYYNDIEGASFCKKCDIDKLCPIGSSKQYNKETFFVDTTPKIDNPEYFSADSSLNLALNSLVLLGVVFGWILFLIIVGCLWHFKCINFKQLMDCPSIFKTPHPKYNPPLSEKDYETINKFKNKMKGKDKKERDTQKIIDTYAPSIGVTKKAVDGFLFSVFAIGISIGIIGVSVYLFFTGKSDNEIRSLIPTVLNTKKQNFTGDLSISLEAKNYQSICKMGIDDVDPDKFSDCNDAIWVEIEGFTYTNEEVKCKRNSELECMVTVDIKKSFISNGVDDGTIKVFFGTQNAFASEFIYEIGASTGYPNGISSIRGTILSDSDKVFRGIYPPTQITSNYLRTHYDREYLGIISQNGYGNHLEYLKKENGNQLLETEFPLENGFSFSFLFLKSNYILKIDRFNDSDLFSIFPTLLGNMVGILGGLGIGYGIFHAIYTCFGCKNDFSHLGRKNQEMMKEKRSKQIKELKKGVNSVKVFVNQKLLKKKDQGTSSENLTQPILEDEKTTKRTNVNYTDIENDDEFSINS